MGLYAKPLRIYIAHSYYQKTFFYYDLIENEDKLTQEEAEEEDVHS